MRGPRQERSVRCRTLGRQTRANRLAAGIASKSSFVSTRIGTSKISFQVGAPTVEAAKAGCRGCAVLDRGANADDREISSSGSRHTWARMCWNSCYGDDLHQHEEREHSCTLRQRSNRRKKKDTRMQKIANCYRRTRSNFRKFKARSGSSS